MEAISSSCKEGSFKIDFGVTPVGSLEVLDSLEVEASGCFTDPDSPPPPPPPLLAAFTSLARRMPSLKTLEWDVEEEYVVDDEEDEVGGGFAWRVVRGGDGEVHLVDAGSTYRRVYCCFSWDAVDRATRGLVQNPLFDFPANFEPKFTLDDFVVRRV